MPEGGGHDTFFTAFPPLATKGGTPPFFVSVDSRGLTGANLVSIDSAGLAGAVFASDAMRPTHSKGVRDLEGRKVEESKVERLRVESAELRIASGQGKARLGATFIGHVTSLVNRNQVGIARPCGKNVACSNNNGAVAPPSLLLRASPALFTRYWLRVVREPAVLM